MHAIGEARVLVQAPCEALRPLVRRFLVVESVTAHGDAHLPDTGCVAAFRFRGMCRLDGAAEAPRSAITGLWDTVRRHSHSGDHAAVIVAFTPTGAAAWLRQPLEEIGNTTVDLEEMVGRRAGLDRLEDRLAGAANHAERIRLVEDLLLAQAGAAQAGAAQADPLIDAAVALIEQTQAGMRIGELTRRIGLSQSALERRFRRVVGASPRRFASLVRLQNVLRLRATGAGLTTIAHAAGYSDQPHFNRDFKRFTRVAPGAFFAREAGG